MNDLVEQYWTITDAPDINMIAEHTKYFDNGSVTLRVNDRNPEDMPTFSLTAKYQNFPDKVVVRGTVRELAELRDALIGILEFIGGSL